MHHHGIIPMEATVDHPLGTPVVGYSLAEMKRRVAESPEAAMEYARGYFARGSKGVYVWDPSTRDFELLKLEVFERTYLPATLVHRAGGTVWGARKWFSSEENHELFRADQDPALGRVFTKCGVLVLNLMPPALVDAPAVAPWEQHGAEARRAASAVFAHIRASWCSGDEGQFKYVMCWLARVLANGRNDSALYLKGRMGIGKSIVTNFLRDKVIGAARCLVTDSIEPFVGKFCSELRGRTLVVIEEAPAESAGEWVKLSKALNAKITDPKLRISQKYMDPVEVKNTGSYIVISNDSAIRMTADDRRFVVLDLSDARKGDLGYFDALGAAMEVDGVGAAFAAKVMEYSRRPFAARAIPQTEAKKAVVAEALHPVFDFIKAEFLAKGHGVDMTFKAFFAAFREWMKAVHPGKTVEHYTKVGKKLDMIPRKRARQGDGGDAKVVLCAPFETLRDHFAAQGWLNEYDDVARRGDDGGAAAGALPFDDLPPPLPATLDELAALEEASGAGTPPPPPPATPEELVPPPPGFGDAYEACSEATEPPTEPSEADQELEALVSALTPEGFEDETMEEFAERQYREFEERSAPALRAFAASPIQPPSRKERGPPQKKRAAIPTGPTLGSIADIPIPAW